MLQFFSFTAVKSGDIHSLNIIAIRGFANIADIDCLEFGWETNESPSYFMISFGTGQHH